MGISRSDVSKLERRAGVRVSTLSGHTDARALVALQGPEDEAPMRVLHPRRKRGGPRRGGRLANPMRKRRMRRVGGTPIEEAPIWALGILTLVLWLVVFPGLVGFLNGFHLLAGGGWTLAAASGVICILMVVGLARQRPWKRPSAGEPSSGVPVFVRFSTWLITTLVLPNVLFGTLVLSRRGEGLDYLSAWMIGLIVSTIHGGFALAERWRGRER